VSIIRTYKFRIYPNESQKEKLESMFLVQ